MWYNSLTILAWQQKHKHRQSGGTQVFSQQQRKTVTDLKTITQQTKGCMRHSHGQKNQTYEIITPNI